LKYFPNSDQDESQWGSSIKLFGHLLVSIVNYRIAKKMRSYVAAASL